MFGAWDLGLGFRKWVLVVWDLRFGVWDLGSRIKVKGFIRFRNQGLALSGLRGRPGGGMDPSIMWCF